MLVHAAWDLLPAGSRAALVLELDCSPPSVLFQSVARPGACLGRPAAVKGGRTLVAGMPRRWPNPGGRRSWVTQGLNQGFLAQDVGTP